MKNSSIKVLVVNEVEEILCLTSEDVILVRDTIDECFDGFLHQIYDFLGRRFWIVYDIENPDQRKEIKEQGLKKGEYLLASDVDRLVQEYLKHNFF